MFLTKEQQQILKDASSGLTAKQFFRLSKTETDMYADRVEEALKVVQAMNPNAFLWRYNRETPDSPKIDIQSEMEKRKFFDAPAGAGKYKSAEKYRTRFPESYRAAQGVK